MAQGVPKSHFYGFDYHGPSIERARKSAAAAGVSDVHLRCRDREGLPRRRLCAGRVFRLPADMGDPAGAARHVHSTCRRWRMDGSGAFANDKVEDNLIRSPCILFCFDFICTPASLAQEVGLGLGAQAGEARLRTVIAEVDSGTFAGPPKRRSHGAGGPAIAPSSAAGSRTPEPTLGADAEDYHAARSRHRRPQ